MINLPTKFEVSTFTTTKLRKYGKQGKM